MDESSYCRRKRQDRKNACRDNKAWWSRSGFRVIRILSSEKKFSEEFVIMVKDNNFFYYRNLYHTLNITGGS